MRDIWNTVEMYEEECRQELEAVAIIPKESFVT